MGEAQALGSNEVQDLIARIANELRTDLSQRGILDPVMIGIHTGGVWVAERLHQILGIREPLGSLDISFYRDDFTRIGMHPLVRPSSIPFSLEDRHVLLVDDVLQSGRTVRAALNEIFDYGRPASVALVTLVERDGRELPIEPKVSGMRVEGCDNRVTLTGPNPLNLIIGQTKREARAGSPG
ncbi:MAG: bifunctional pyr operon transcriptional regulator/uracil phosphoribosyltransferase PyrR [Gammaproteobacteria bacterium]|nr:bifunctional pyr operon transcriptional regulator/uracil phosphoribosyltransferase PyrR [Gammaproteobacteria bacterium]MBU1654861.1 bifunctional pyr operon transcriptional regulator/uracil phosphoribosyltransferase PyrR [Gammaproteobacteria bacterium]MBU1961152.1 bifunctional pyr operon transcriptional regulator/uracil phosphoribosyltransferase PyrR [Gammaproteobacteria bacterium]